uniref:Aly/REF n=1 Tax=Macrobrachium nipponense TaxID=159736 RepID=A0A8K1DZV4_MACNP|nr:Aly/REF [Macrobrachium nipponense]
MNMSLEDVIKANQTKNPQQQQGYGGNQRPPLMGPKPPLMGMRPPMYLTKSSGKLTISNLDPGVTEADMSTLFSEFGEIKEAAIHFDRNGKSLGSAHIIFEQYGDAVRGMQRYNGITLDGRPMAMHIEKLPGPPGTFKITPQVNSVMGGGAKPVKRLQKGPQQQIGNIKQIGKQQFGNNKPAGKQQMGNIKQVQNNRAANNNQMFNNKQTMNKQTQNNNQKANNKQIINIQTKKKTMPQQQSGIMKWPANMQMGYGISKGYSFGVPAGGVGLLQGTGSLTGLARPGVLGRLDGVSSQGLLGHSPGYQTAPSVLDRLDGGVQINNYVGQNKPLMPNPPVLSRLGGTVGGTSSSGSVFNRMGPKQGIAQHGKTTAAVPAVAGQQWSFAIPGGLAVTQKKR